MSLATFRIGLPSLGVDRQSRTLIPAPQLDRWHAHRLGGWRFARSRELQPWPLVANFADTPDTDQITRLANPRWGDGTGSLVRHNASSFRHLLGGNWAAATPAAGFPTSSGFHWGADVVPSAETAAGNNGNGVYMFSNRVIGPYYWFPAIGGGVALAVGGASLPARHIISYADRAFLFNLLAGGTIRGRSAIWSVAGDGLTFTGTGSGDKEFTELDGEITAVGIIRRSLVVYSRNSIVIGEETFIPDSPVAYSPVVSRGRGVWAPDSLLQFADVHAGLAEDGFWTFDGSTFQDIGAPINDDILSRINRTAVNSVWGVVKPDWQMAIWALPMDGNNLPNEIWGYNYARNAWTQLDALSYFGGVPPTAGAVIFLGSALPWNDAFFALAPSDQWNEHIGKRWVDFRGESVRPTIVVGLNNGNTKTLDDTQSTTSAAFTIETPDFTFDAAQLQDTTTSRVYDSVEPGDITTLDEVTIIYSAAGSLDSTLYLQISADGGATWTGFGSETGAIVLPATDVGQRGRVSVNGRTSAEQIRLRFSNADPVTGVLQSCQIKPEDFYFSIRKAGEIRV